MRQGAQTSAPASSPAADVPHLRALPVEPASDREALDRLVQRLAADRLRDLRDDGVTLAYVARMYDTDPSTMTRLADELTPGRG